jgi:hypothetical protein
MMTCKILRVFICKPSFNCNIWLTNVFVMLNCYNLYISLRPIDHVLFFTFIVFGFIPDNVTCFTAFAVA